MGTQIYLKPEDAWDYFTKEKEHLSDTQVEIAHNENTGTSVCITCENGFPLFNVYRDKRKVYKEPAVKEDCFSTLRDIYIKHLFPIVTSNNKAQEAPKQPPKRELNYVVEDGAVKKSKGCDGPQDNEDEIYEREDELECAAYDILLTFLSERPEKMFGETLDDVMKEIVDHFCEYLATEYGVSVYRPTWLPCEDDEQTLVFTEFPYDEAAEITEFDKKD